MIKLAPSILSADFANLQRDIELVERHGADYIHVDVMDGHFVPNITLAQTSLKRFAQLPKLLDVHLMITEPEKYIHAFAEAGADIIGIHAKQHLISIVRSKWLWQKMSKQKSSSTQAHQYQPLNMFYPCVIKC